MRLVATLIALVAIAPTPADKVAFGPEKGLKLEKRFEMKMHLEQKSMRMSIGDNDLPSELTSSAEMELKSHQKVVVADEYREVGDEHADVLARKFVEMADSSEEHVKMPGMEEAQDHSREKKSDLEGETVIFRWNEKDGEFKKEWDGEGADNALLEKLEQDMDFVKILPSKGVEVGDSWELDLADFDQILGPGGELGFKGDEDDNDDDNTDFQDNLAGEVKCTYKGMEEEGGRKLARIAAVVTGKTFQDQEQGEGGQLHMAFDLNLEGEFLWDVAAKHLASYRLGGEMTSEMKLTQEVDMGGKTGEIVIHIELGGTMEIEGEIKAP